MTNSFKDASEQRREAGLNLTLGQTEYGWPEREVKGQKSGITPRQRSSSRLLWGASAFVRRTDLFLEAGRGGVLFRWRHVILTPPVFMQLYPQAPAKRRINRGLHHLSYPMFIHNASYSSILYKASWRPFTPTPHLAVQKHGSSEAVQPTQKHQPHALHQGTQAHTAHL